METRRRIAAQAALCSACLAAAAAAALVLLSSSPPSFDFGELARFAPDPWEPKPGPPAVRRSVVRERAARSSSSSDPVRAASFASGAGARPSPRGSTAAAAAIVSFSS